MNAVGIDVSKGKSMVCVMRPFGEVVLEPFEVLHTAQNLHDLAEKLNLLKTNATTREMANCLCCGRNCPGRNASADYSLIVT